MRLTATLLFIAATAGAQADVVVFSGTVLDSTKKPLANAEVMIGLGTLKATDAKGLFRMETTPGIHHVTVRKIGFAQLDTTMTFPLDQEVIWRVTMTAKVVTLDSVVVRAPMEPWQVEFEANRKRGFGRFMTREDLLKLGQTPLPTALRRLSGAEIMRTNNNAAYIASKRGPITGCPPPAPAANPRGAFEAQEKTDECLRRERIYYVPDGAERQMGVKRACYPVVYMDNQIMTPGRPTPPFDLGTFAVADQLDAVEWYESESQTPPKYSVNIARCGVLVLHVHKKK
jgi:hypothetical protein